MHEFHIFQECLFSKDLKKALGLVFNGDQLEFKLR